MAASSEVSSSASAALAEDRWWEKRLALDPAALRVVEFCWKRFAETRAWPTFREVLRQAGGIVEYERITSLAGNRTTSTRDWASPTFNAVLHLAEVRDLLAPLPKVLALACEAFKAAPNYVSSQYLTGVRFDDVRPLWPARAELALAFMREYSVPHVSWGGSDEGGWSFTPGYSILQFSKVLPLEAALSNPARPTTLGRELEPGSPHSEVLKRVFEWARTHAEWPEAVDFAVRNGDLGYVPQLVDDLAEARFTNRFEGGKFGKVELRPLAVRALGPEVMSVAVRLVRGLARIFEASDTGEGTPSQLATTLELDPKLVAAGLMLLERDVGVLEGVTLRGPMESWRFHVQKNALNLETLSSWEEIEQAALHSEGINSVADLLSGRRAAVPADIDADELAPLRAALLGRGLTLGSHVGTGGFGRVFEAAHASLGRRAVKVFWPNVFELNPERVRQRFNQEGVFIGQVNSPNVVKIHDAVLDASPPFIVTEFVEGKSVDTLVRENGLLSADFALEILESMLLGLEAIHSVGLLHRDIAPKNVMWDAKAKRAVLIDFGFAGYLHEVSGDQHLTTTSFGTGAFVAPEFRTDPHLKETSLDLFGATAVLHYMLTGSPPNLANPDDRLRANSVPEHLIDLVLGGIAEKRRYADVATIRRSIDRARREPAGSEASTETPAPLAAAERTPDTERSAMEALEHLERNSPSAGIRLRRSVAGVFRELAGVRLGGDDRDLNPDAVFAAYSGTRALVGVLTEVVEHVVSAQHQDGIDAFFRGVEELATSRRPPPRPGLVPPTWRTDVQRLLLLETIEVFASVCVLQNRFALLGRLLSEPLHCRVEFDARTQTIGALGFGFPETLQAEAARKKHYGWSIWPQLMSERYPEASTPGRLTATQLREGDSFLALGTRILGAERHESWPPLLLWLDSQNNTRSVGPIRWLARCRSRKVLTEIETALGRNHEGFVKRYTERRGELEEWYRDGYSADVQIRDWLIDPKELGSVP